MEIKRTFQVLVLAVVICPWNTFATTVGIDSGIVIPSLPTETDEITFDISGWANQGQSWVENDEYSRDGTSLELNLYIETGSYHDFTTWTFSKSISTLPANTYILEVNSFDYNDGSLDDTYILEFTVIPEPTSISFLFLGLFFLNKVSNRHNK